MKIAPETSLLWTVSLTHVKLRNVHVSQVQTQSEYIVTWFDKIRRCECGAGKGERKQVPVMSMFSYGTIYPKFPGQMCWPLVIQ